MKDTDWKNFKNTKKKENNKIKSTLYIEMQRMLYIVGMCKWEEIDE